MRPFLNMELTTRGAGVPVWAASGLLSHAGFSLHPRRTSGLAIADRLAWQRWSSLLEALMRRLVDHPSAPLLLESGEPLKEASRLPDLWEALAAGDLDRDSRLVVIGGGTLLDVGAFLAGTYLRGLDTVLVPTTLLAQVDAGLGGKCGVNLQGTKNQVGLIRQPSAVLVDPDILSSLPEKAWLSGVGEVAKTALLAGGELLSRARALSGRPRPGGAVLEEIVRGCLRFKAELVCQDPEDRGVRTLLNLGHTVGHVLEGLAAAQRIDLPHGAAVAAGLWGETRILAPRGSGLPEVECLLSELGLPRQVPLPWDAGLAERLLWGDKKRARDRVRVPVLEAAGQPVIREVAGRSLLEAVREALTPA